MRYKSSKIRQGSENGNKEVEKRLWVEKVERIINEKRERKNKDIG